MALAQTPVYPLQADQDAPDHKSWIPLGNISDANPSNFRLHIFYEPQGQSQFTPPGAQQELGKEFFGSIVSWLGPDNIVTSIPQGQEYYGFGIIAVTTICVGACLIGIYLHISWDLFSARKIASALVEVQGHRSMTNGESGLLHISYLDMSR